MNHFVEVMYSDGKTIQYHQLKFPKTNVCKIKDGNVVDPQIWNLWRTRILMPCSEEKKSSSEVFKVSEQFLSKYKKTTGYLLKIFFKHLEIWDVTCLLNCTSFRVIYIFCQANFEMLVTSVMRAETKISPPWNGYQGKWSSALLVDYCWQLER